VRYPTWDADVAQLVEHQLPKLRVAGSNPVVRFAPQTRTQTRTLGFLVRLTPSHGGAHLVPASAAKSRCWSAAAATDASLGHIEVNEPGADRVGRVLAASLIARADPDLMAGGN
jgi:hypothetical protein